MATKNPFAGDNVKGAIWERGYMAGFNRPDDQPFLPLEAELLEVYVQGAAEGRIDKSRPLDNGLTWCDAATLPPVGPDSPEFENLSESEKELISTLVVHTTFELLEHIFAQASIGLVGLIVEVVQIPGDVGLRTLEPEFTGPINEEGVVFLGICPRTDHEFSNKDPWVGPVRNSFLEATADIKAHNHSEAFVVRASIQDGRIGPVWAAR